MVALLSDHLPLVRASALRALQRLVAMVTTVRGTDATIFPEYILPSLRDFASDDEVKTPPHPPFPLTLPPTVSCVYRKAHSRLQRGRYEIEGRGTIDPRIRQ